MKNYPKLTPIKAISDNSNLPSFLFFKAIIFCLLLPAGASFAAFSAHDFTIVMCDNVTSGGAIEGNETGCPDPIFDPSPITNVTLPSGGTGDLEYVWIFTTGDPTAPVSAWTPIPNSNAPDYDPGPITVTTHYRRCARRSGCDEYVGETNIITKMVSCCSNVTDGGAIEEDQQICDSSYDPDLIRDAISPSGGTGDLEYQWFQSTTGTPFVPNSPDWTLIPGATDAEYDPGVITQTTYYIRCSRRSECVDFTGKSNIVAVQLFDAPKIDTVITSNLSCFDSNDGTIDLQISGGQTPYTFSWDPDLGNVEDPTGLSAGTYTVTILDANVCGVITEVMLLQPDEIVPQIEVFIADTCNYASGGTVVVTATGGVGPLQFSWSDSQNTQNDTLTDLPGGTYYVTISDSTGCMVIDSVFVPLPDTFQFSFTKEDVSCFGAADGAIDLSIIGGAVPYQFDWSPSFGNVEDLEDLSGGIYQITVFDANRCSLSAEIEIFEPAQIITTISMQIDTCNYDSGGTAVVEVVNGIGPIQILWSNGATTDTLAGVRGGTYFVTITDSTGCAVVDSVIIPLPDPFNFSFDKEDVSCNGLSDGSVIATVSGGTGGYQYLWNDPDQTTQPELDSLIAGTYILIVTDSAGCSKADSVIINQPDTLKVSIIPTPAGCNQSGGRAAANVSGGTGPYTFLWNDSNAQNTPTAINLTPGIYTVNISDFNGCTVTDSVEITFITGNVSLDIFKEDATCNGSGDGKAWAIPSGGAAPYTFLWSDLAGQTTDTLFNVNFGVYYVTARDVDGCEATDSVTIDYLSNIQLSLQKTDITCFGDNNGAIQSQVSGAFGSVSYQWSNSAVTPNITNLSPGVYHLNIVDSLGCNASGSAVILEPALLVCDITITSDYNGFDISRYGGTDGSVRATATGGTGTYTFIWSNGRIGSNQIGLLSGNYRLTVTDANGCTCESDVTLTQPARITGFTWHDLNENGIQENNEPGLSGVHVMLNGADINGNPVTKNTFSNGLGIYSFDTIRTGDYRVTFGSPVNFLITQRDAGNNDNLDSDADPATGVSDTFSIQTGQVADRDCGYKFHNPSIEIGDYVWYDSDRDGVQDFLEGGVFDFRVSLVDAASHTILRTEFTDADGRYLFTDVQPGSYYILFHSISIPFGSKFTRKDVGTNDEMDSDADTLTGRTAVFTITLNQPDNLSYDAGIYEVCDNIVFGGAITGDEQLCGPGQIASTITNVSLPTGGFGQIEYLWLYSYTPVFTGSGDPNWFMLPNTNTPDYSPGVITQTTYFIRCARRDGCTDYSGESNIVKKEVLPLPNAVIINPPVQTCVNEATNFSAEPASGSASFAWTFSGGANPATADTRLAPGIVWSSTGLKTVILEVTRQNCSARDTALVNVMVCTNRLGNFNYFNATQLGKSMVRLEWETDRSDRLTVFAVEKSLDGNDFFELAKISGKDNNNGSRYSYSDFTEMGEKNFYRLKHMDVLSNYVYSEIREVAIADTEIASAKIYPNPAKEKVRLELLVKNAKSKRAELVDEKGALIQSRILPEGAQMLEFDLRHLPDGVYFIKLKTDSGKEEVYKVLHYE